MITSRPLGDLEAAHGAAALLHIGEGLQTLLGLKTIPPRMGLTQLRVDSGPLRIGNFPRGVVGLDGVFGQGVLRKFLAEILDSAMKRRVRRVVRRPENAGPKLP